MSPESEQSVSEIESEIVCELFRALLHHEVDETPAEAFYEAWDANRERSGPLNDAVHKLHRRGLIRVRTRVDRTHEIGNERPLVSTELVVQGVTDAGAEFLRITASESNALAA